MKYGASMNSNAQPIIRKLRMFVNPKEGPARTVRRGAGHPEIAALMA